MKFSANEDIDASIDAVFDHFSDFGAFERAALRRGADVRRKDNLAAPGPGMAWHAAFDLRGKRRQVEVQMVRFDRPQGLLLHSTSSGISGSTLFDLTALSPDRTRLHAAMELKPESLSARLLVQSLKLAKHSLSRRFKQRVADHARKVEAQRR